MSKLIIFDTETTGLEEEDRIIQVGAIVSDLKDKEKFNVYNELCSSDIPIKIEAMATHGIRQLQIEDKVPFNETDFLKELIQLNNEENYLVAHNLDFDLAMLQKEGFANKLKLIDTLQCAKHLYGVGDEINEHKVPNHKLQTFRYMMFTQQEEDTEAAKYGVEIKAHDAIGDVVILKMFLRELYKKIRQKYDIKEPIEIMNKMQELTKMPAEVKIMPYGQYKGKKLLEIEGIKELNKWGKPTGPSYIDWLYKDQKEKKESQDPYFNSDLLWTLDKVIKRRNNNSGHNIVF